MKKGLKTFYTVSYVVLTLLTLLMLIGTIVSIVQGKTDVLTGGLAAFVFVVFAILQVICLALYKPGVTLYKIGFYLLHAGLLVLLVGFLAFAIAGEEFNVEVPVNSYGVSNGVEYEQFYSEVRNGENGESHDLGFGFRIKNFNVEKYEDTGNDKFYHADLTYRDPATLAQEEGVLEVNNTERRNGWKIYLMSYNDGATTLRNLYGITDDQYYGVYSADGMESGSELVSLVEQDLGGYYVTYYKYENPDDTIGHFELIDEGKLALNTQTLYAHVFAEGNQVAVYINDSFASFDDSCEGNGEDILAYIADKYPDQQVLYYDFDLGQIYYPDNVRMLTENYTAEIKVTDSTVSVYLMREKFTPADTFTEEGGSALLASVAEKYPAGAKVIYQVYNRQTGAFMQASRLEVMEQMGAVKAYALAMGDDLLVYVHPVSVHLFFKQDPGEFAVLAGIALLFAGTILTCLIRGRKKNDEERAAAKNQAQTAQTNRSGKVSNGKGGRR